MGEWELSYNEEYGNYRSTSGCRRNRTELTVTLGVARGNRNLWCLKIRPQCERHIRLLFDRDHLEFKDLPTTGVSSWYIPNAKREIHLLSVTFKALEAPARDQERALRRVLRQNCHGLPP